MTARVLHVAALPFPSSQGTQAALLAIVSAAARDAASRAERVALLTYESGDGRRVLPDSVEHRRTHAPIANRSLRSGPSLAKIAEDVALVRALREAREPDIVAHHVEAGLACVLAGRRFTWVAHTALGPELPLYAPSRTSIAPLLSASGEALDRFVARRAQRVLAISPFLARRLEAVTGTAATVLPTPWSVAPPVSDAERAASRTALGLASDHEVILYAGNLDHYQGLDAAIAALGRLAHRRGRLRWLVASQSAPHALEALARRSGLGPRIVLAPLATDEDRRRAHAAADVCVVPRRLEAGVSIKILEALAHGLPTVAVRAATGGFPFEDACRVVEADPSALAQALAEVLDEPFVRLALGAAGPAHLAAHHSDAACVSVLAGR
ncbi:MAG: glycosyltransferase family 4 protein, partial [Sandaracinaceae bacterium]|nr:glycosyltransferase family 4 protein [Sandaracinaceae bacterium]